MFFIFIFIHSPIGTSYADWELALAQPIWLETLDTPGQFEWLGFVVHSNETRSSGCLLLLMFYLEVVAWSNHCAIHNCNFNWNGKLSIKILSLISCVIFQILWLKLKFKLVLLNYFNEQYSYISGSDCFFILINTPKLKGYKYGLNNIY